MSECVSFTCDYTCGGYWSGCRAYSCVDMVPVTAIVDRVTITDTEGICTHTVTKINDYSGSWSDHGAILRDYHEYTNVAANEGNVVYDEHIKDLRDAINEERYRRYNSGFASYTGLNQKVWTADIATGTNISLAVSELSAAINEIQSGSVNIYPNSGEVVNSSHIDSVRKSIETLRKSCICDTDCGSNTVCACYCDCGCNYSDRKLKRNIRDI